MEKNCPSAKNDFIETMFKSLNFYTEDLEKELETLDRKLNDQIRIAENYQKVEEKLQRELIELRANIETENVKNSIFDRNLTERRNLSKTFEKEIVEKRREQNSIVEKLDENKLKNQRTIGKIVEQCANLTLAFRTNFHGYARADFDEIRRKTEEKMKNLLDEVKKIENSIEKDREKFFWLDETFEKEKKKIRKLKSSADLITEKIRSELDEIRRNDDFERKIDELKTSIETLEIWNRRTNFPNETN